MFCGKCGKEIPDGAQFCMHCGAKAGNSVMPSVNIGNNKPVYSQPIMPAYPQPTAIGYPQTVVTAKSLADKGSKKWSLGVIIVIGIFIITSAINGVFSSYDLWRFEFTVSQGNYYSFGAYFVSFSRLMGYFISYLLIPLLTLLVFILPTKKKAWVTIIPCFLSTAGFVFNALSNGGNVFFKLTNVAIVILFGVLYFISILTKKEKTKLLMIIFLSLLAVIKTVITFISYSRQVLVNKPLPVPGLLYSPPTMIFGTLSSLMFCLVFIFAAAQLYKEQKQAGR